MSVDGSPPAGVASNNGGSVPSVSRSERGGGAVPFGGESDRSSAGPLLRHVPRLPRVYVPRPRLWDRLDAAADGAVTLVVAPAGAGKTLGVAGWLTHAARGRADDMTWIHADAGWCGDRLGELLDASASEAPPRLVVVDDAHALPSEALNQIDRRLGTAPDSMRVLLLSRWDLPLTWLVPELLGHFTALRGDLLWMDDKESAGLVVEHARTDDQVVVDAVTRRAQGWPAVVVLASRAIAATPDPVAAAKRLGEQGTPIADRVASEVFSTLSPRQRHLLLCTSGDEVVSVSTAVHLSHDAQAADVLSEMEATGLLVNRLPDNEPQDSGDPRYRIHPLLTEVVRRRVAAGGVDVTFARSTVVRAVRLDVERGDLATAFSRLVAVDAPEEALDVLVRQGVPMVLGEAGVFDIGDFVRRHPDVVQRSPEAWFVIALQRWIAEDLESCQHWMNKVLEHHAAFGSPHGLPEELDPFLAAVHLWRARIGLEDIEAAAAHAASVVTAWQSGAMSHPAAAELLPVLTFQLGVVQNWIGDLTSAQKSLVAASQLSRTRGLGQLVAAAMSHLAFNEYMSGREHSCASVARSGLDLAARSTDPRRTLTSSRSQLALLLGTMADIPFVSGLSPDELHVPSGLHEADVCTRFWARLAEARLALAAGSASRAQQILSLSHESPMLEPSALPRHLRGALLVERAFLAALGSDVALLVALEDDLRDQDFLGEHHLVAGLRADLLGERRQAADAFDAAARTATLAQPATQALALACRAQLLDALGDEPGCLRSLDEAVTVTELRRNAVPFLGWARQGTPMETLLTRLSRTSSRPWLLELAEAAAGRADITSIVAPTVPSPREREGALSPVVSPTLSPREREVLAQLARGATYADIAASLYVSENTVKTHVSSLYSKLAVSRRSEALAVARTLHLL